MEQLDRRLHSVLYFLYVVTMINTFASKAENEFPRLCEHLNLSLDSPPRSVISELSLRLNTDIHPTLLLHLNEIDEFAAPAACKMSLDLETVEKDYELKINNIHRSHQRYKNIKGTQCNVSLDIAFVKKEQETQSKNGNPATYFPNVAKLIMPEPELISSDKSLKPNLLFLYVSYELRKMDETGGNECYQQFQEFDFTVRQVNTALLQRLNSTSCRCMKCNSNSGKAMVISKVVMSCVVVFAAIIFTGCFVMICACKSVMNVCPISGSETRK